MASSHSPEDRQRYLRWLDQGVELARAKHGSRASYRHVIWLLIEKAVEDIDSDFDQQHRWLTSGTRSGGWNAVGLTHAELRELERIRVLSSIAPYDGPSRHMPSATDIERAVDVLTWLRWIGHTKAHQDIDAKAERDKRLQKAAMTLARCGAVEAVFRIYGPERTRPRQVVHEIKTRTIGAILRGLREDLGIVPADDGLSFTEAVAA